jgi:hypothetical protein
MCSRIPCDNPDCVVNVDQLGRQDPGDDFELVEHVRTVAAVEVGWTHLGDSEQLLSRARGRRHLTKHRRAAM